MIPAPNRTLYTASNREIYCWAIGGLASHGLIIMFGKANEVFTIWFGLSPVLVGWAMMIPRILDALLDPYLGHCSDNTRTRWGRRKPFLFGSAVAGAISLFALWWADPAWSSTAQLAYLVAIGTFLYISYGLYTMAWTALGYELTDDYHERSRIQALAFAAATMISLGIGWMNRAALLPVFGGVIYGVRWIGAGMGLLVIGAMAVVLLKCDERFAEVKRDHVPLLTAVKTALKHRPFVLLLIFRFCQVFGERVFLGLLMLVGICYVCRGDQTLATTYTGYGATLGAILGLALVPVMKRISQKLGKRKGLIVAASIGLAVAVALPLILSPSFPLSLVIPQMIVQPLILFTGTLSNAVVPDICDLDELTAGTRREGLFSAVMGLVQKLELSLTVLIVGYFVSFSGYDPKLPMQPEAVQEKLLWFATGPYIVFAALTLLAAILFPMTEASVAEVRRKLDECRLAGSRASASDEASAPSCA